MDIGLLGIQPFRKRLILVKYMLAPLFNLPKKDVFSTS